MCGTCLPINLQRAHRDGQIVISSHLFVTKGTFYLQNWVPPDIKRPDVVEPPLYCLVVLGRF